MMGCAGKVSTESSARAEPPSSIPPCCFNATPSVAIVRSDIGRHFRQCALKRGGASCCATREAGMSDETAERFTWGCLCGNVRIETAGRPYRVGLCHCLDCRKHHGALFFAAAIFPQEAVTVEGDTGEYRGRHFCPRCGSSVFARFND